MIIELHDRIANEGIRKVCSDICPIECNSISYSITPYSRPWQYNLIGVSIYYENFYYTSNTEIPKISSDNLFANIGGILGLFLGASVLSFAELIEMVIYVIVISFKKFQLFKHSLFYSLHLL